MKREVEIIDRLALPKSSPSPIKLVACLQTMPEKVDTINGPSCYYFYPSNYDSTIAQAKRIERLTHVEDSGYDLIMVISVNDHDEEIQSLYLGFWNDGVIS